MPRDVGKLRPLFPENTQNLPASAEVAGEEERDQQLYQFYWLESEQIHLGIAGTWTRAERDQCDRKCDSTEQRQITEAPEQALDVSMDAMPIATIPRTTDILSPRS